MKRFQLSSLVAVIAAVALQITPTQQADARYHHHHHYYSRNSYVSSGYGYNTHTYYHNGHRHNRSVAITSYSRG